MTIPISLPGVELQWLHSNILKRDLQLYIKHPWTYDHSDKFYPTLYCTDANRSFPLYSTTSLIIETPGPGTPEILIVGIGYQVDTNRIKALAQWSAWRMHDLTPVNRAEIDQWWVDKLTALMEGEKVEVHSGGAGDFLNCIQQEIIPFIEKNYRVSPTDRGLAGYSYGGLFTMFSLFHAPELFQRYFAGSPSMWPQLFVDEENFAATHTDLSAKLFITAGSNETDLLKDLSLLKERLRSRSYPGLELLTHVFDGDGHASAYAASISRALCMLYNKGWLQI